MKVLDLQCDQRHVFEGWFASEDDYANQLARGLLLCPLCASSVVTKMLSAPRLNFGASQPANPTQSQAASSAPNPATSAAASPSPSSSANAAGSSAPAPTPGHELVNTAMPQEMQAAWLQLTRRILAQTDDVGNQFASEARKMHYGEVPERGIRGQATPEQTLELLDEGINVLPLPIPEALKEPLQ